MYRVRKAVKLRPGMKFAIAAGAACEKSGEAAPQNEEDRARRSFRLRENAGVCVCVFRPSMGKFF